MAYKISVSSKAQKEFHKAIDYYKEVSVFLPSKFINAIQETYIKLAINPFYEIRKNSIRAIPVQGFPFIVLFSINERNKEIKVLSCFHTSKNPRRYPK